MATRISDNDLGWAKILKRARIEASNGEQARDVGWPEPELGARATFIEYGTQNMDAQPFIRPTLDAGRARYESALERCADAVTDGDVAAPHLDDAASLFASDLRDACPVDTGELRAGITVVEGGE